MRKAISCSSPPRTWCLEAIKEGMGEAAVVDVDAVEVVAADSTSTRVPITAIIMAAIRGPTTGPFANYVERLAM